MLLTVEKMKRKLKEAGMATTRKKHCFSRYSSSSFLFVFIQFCAKRERESDREETITLLTVDGGHTLRKDSTQPILFL